MKGSTIGLIVAGVIATIMFIVGLSWYNGAVSLTNTTEAQWRDNQNSYDAFWKTVKETAQITDRYKEDFKQVLIGATELRFKNTGGTGVFALAEANPALAPEVYTQLQRVVEAGRIDFKRSQTTLLDKQRALKNHLQHASGNFFGMFFSFPRVASGDFAPPKDLDGDGVLTALDYPIVTSATTKKVFEEAESEPIQVFSN